MGHPKQVEIDFYSVHDVTSLLYSIVERSRNNLFKIPGMVSADISGKNSRSLSVAETTKKNQRHVALIFLIRI